MSSGSSQGGSKRNIVITVTANTQAVTQELQSLQDRIRKSAKTLGTPIKSDVYSRAEKRSETPVDSDVPLTRVQPFQTSKGQLISKEAAQSFKQGLGPQAESVGIQQGLNDLRVETRQQTRVLRNAQVRELRASRRLDKAIDNALGASGASEDPREAGGEFPLGEVALKEIRNNAKAERANRAFDSLTKRDKVEPDTLKGKRFKTAEDAELLSKRQSLRVAKERNRIDDIKPPEPPKQVKPVEPPPITKAAAIQQQIKQGKRGPLLQAGDLVDKKSFDFLKKINPAHRTNPQISDAAQVFLGLGGVLTQISPALGALSLQAGFASFAFGGFGVVLVGITSIIGAGIFAVKSWARATLSWIKIARESGFLTASSSQGMRKFSNSVSMLQKNLGKVSAKAFEPLIATLNKLAEASGSPGSGLLQFQESLASFTNDVLNSAVVLGAATLRIRKDTVATRFRVTRGPIVPLGQIKNEDTKNTKNTGPSNVIMAPENRGLYDFLTGLFKDVSKGLQEAVTPLDQFLSSLSKMERLLVVAGDGITKFAQKDVSTQLSRETILKIASHNRVQAIAAEAETLNEAARAGVLQRERLREKFVPSITGLLQAATGIVKEVRDPREPVAAAVREEARALGTLMLKLMTEGLKVNNLEDVMSQLEGVGLK